MPPYQAPAGQPDQPAHQPAAPPPPPPPPSGAPAGPPPPCSSAALVLGGAAGVGGAAAYHGRSPTNGTNNSTTDTSGSFQATKTAVVKDGTVEKVANAVLPSVVKVNVSSQSGAGSGSGIVLSKDGEILTNNHVVAGAGDGRRSR